MGKEFYFVDAGEYSGWGCQQIVVGVWILMIGSVQNVTYFSIVDPETTSGGNSLKFYSSVRLDIRRIGAVKEGDEVIGSETRVKVVKNKVAPPFKQC